MTKLPIVKGKRVYHPTKALCPWCKKRKVLEPHSMAILSGGALVRSGADTYTGPTEGLRGFLSFHWHGAHDGGEGGHRDNDLILDIAQDVDGGLFDVMFCSVKCLRAFLNSGLDEFEDRVRKLKPLAEVRPNKRMHATRKRARA